MPPAQQVGFETTKQTWQILRKREIFDNKTLLNRPRELKIGSAQDMVGGSQEVWIKGCYLYFQKEARRVYI